MLYGDLCDIEDCENPANVYVFYMSGDSVCLACLCWDHRHDFDDVMVTESFFREGKIHEV